MFIVAVNKRFYSAAM